MPLFCLDISATALKLLSSAREPRPEIILDSPSVLIKTAQLRDLGDLSDILTFSFHRPEGLMKWLMPVMRLGIYEDLRQRLINKNTHYACLVALHSQKNGDNEDLASRDLQTGTLHSDLCGTPIGTVEVSVRQRYPWQPNSRYVYLSNLAVREDCRRQGVAHQLLLGCERVATQWGFGDIYLHVLDNNTQANNLYQKLNYRVEQVESDFFAALLNRPRQILLRKRMDV